MIENHKRIGTVAVLSMQAAIITGLEGEDLFIRRIDYDFDLIRMTTARRVDLLACEIHCEREVRKLDAPLF